jgi:hypothetical protein
MSTAPKPKSVVVKPNIYDHDNYVGMECLLGVHHACPGGLKGDAETGGDWVCHCLWEACPCRQKLTT